MPAHSSLLQLVALLGRAAPRCAPFNVFLALRGASDEVRLHSRFIAALINPEGHALGHSLLTSFLEEIEVPISGHDSFSLDGLKVQVEHEGVDILITNSARQAVLIENKIFASDQEKQLRRYHDNLVLKRFAPVFIRYLTLDGHAPSEGSLSGLELELLGDRYRCISYTSHIRKWLESGERVAVRDIPVRESISQYQSVIDRLTGNGQEVGYMNGIVETLLVGENMKLARDIRAAYSKGLVELQDRLWSDIENAIKSSRPQMYANKLESSIATSPERRPVIENFYRPGARNNTNYGIYFSVPGWSGTSVGVEIEDSFFTGAHCSKEDHPGEHQRARSTLANAGIEGAQTNAWTHWRWLARQHNFMEPDEVTLSLLSSETKRAEFALLCAADVAELWDTLRDT